MQAFDPSGRYSDEDVIAALQGVSGQRVIDFRYDRLSNANTYLGPLTSVQTASIAYDSLADIKRTAKLTLLDDGSIDYLSERVKPWVRLRMPDGGWVEWPQGVFLLSTPKRTRKVGGYVARDVDAYDQLVVLNGDLESERITVQAGVLYVNAVGGLVQDMATRITYSPKTLPTAMEWEPGTSRLRIVNDLLSAINYRSAWFDENGVLVCEPYASPDDAQPGYTYATDSTSVIVGDIDDTLDLYSVANRWVLVVSNPEGPALFSSYINSSPTSPTSTVRRGRQITDFRTEQDAADQATLDAKVQRLAFEASQVFESIDFSTAIMPMHSNADVLGLVVNDLGVPSAKFVEQSWSYDLKAGALMAHKVRRTVSVAP